MSHTFIELDIFSAVSSEYYGRVLTSADSPIMVPSYEAEPWIRGQYALPCGPSVELSEEASADLQILLQATTAQFLEEYRNESGTTEAPRGVGEELDDDHAGPDEDSVGDGGGVVGGSDSDDGA